MNDYKRCPTCGAICTVEGKPDFIGDEYPVTMHYEPACDALVRELARVDVEKVGQDIFTVSMMRNFARLAKRIVEATHD